MTDKLERNEEGRVMPPDWYEDYDGGVTIRERYSTSTVRSCAKGSTFPFPISDAYTRESEVLDPQNSELEIGEIKISKHGQDFEKIYTVKEDGANE